MNPISLANLKAPWKPGQSGYEGAPVKGKRIATWMTEYGQTEVAKWPKVGSKAFDKLPGNARIALRRLRAADADEELGLANSKYVEPTAMEVGASADSGTLLAGIALAILAMKAAGVLVATDQQAAAIDVTPTSKEKSDERE